MLASAHLAQAQNHEEVPLYALPGSAVGQITSVHAKGPLARRLVDLGLIPGTRITKLWRGPFGDPTAYRFRGTTIALRRDDAATIWVRPLPDTEAPSMKRGDQ